jgi:hypothetical protein
MEPATKTATEEPLKYKRMKLVLDNSDKPLYFTALDISDPPHLKYYDNLEGLVKDWDDSAHLIIKGVPIALKYWSKVFPRARKEAWEVLKNNWSNWRVLSLILIVTSRNLRASLPPPLFVLSPVVLVIFADCMLQLVVSAVKSYNRIQDFWFTYSDPTGDDENGPRKNWPWTKVLKGLKFQRQQIDDFDTKRARITFHGKDDEWNTHFSYRKGSKLVPLKAEAQIARRFRAIEGSPRFWDYVEEVEGEDGDGESEA